MSTDDSYIVFCSKADTEIERLKLNKRKIYFAFSIQIDDIEKAKQYFTDKGYAFEYTKCPRGLCDIIIRF